jgi:hypothetical protein
MQHATERRVANDMDEMNVNRKRQIASLHNLSDFCHVQTTRTTPEFFLGCR